MPKAGETAADLTGLPIVTDATRAQSENIETIVSRLKSGRIRIPDYQRDADQWDSRKESLFIESLLNNLTIPGFFFAQEGDTIEVVDGQQRLNTILKYVDGLFPISDDEAIVYLSPQSVHYRGKCFSELPAKLCHVINDYPLTIIYLPKSDLNTKLEIFRRINEGGTPLTAQDIRLSFYSESKTVRMIRLAGIHGNTDAAQRMIASAAEMGVENPWAAHSKTYAHWCEWWEGKVKAKGQTPSEMFLWYLVQLNRNELNDLVSSPDTMKHLKMTFRGTTEEVLDIYCAQLHYTDLHGGPIVFPVYGSEEILEAFRGFARWIHAVLARDLPGISVDKYKQLTLLIGAAAELNLEPNELSDDAWDAVAGFIRTPRKAGNQWLQEEGGYPEQKGRWTGNKGQKSQFDLVAKLLSKIVTKHP